MSALAAARRRALGVGRAALNALRPAPPVADPPLVSVVIATYNWSAVLRWAIRSVRGQDYPSWELIVVGDCCTDDSEAVVESFGDPRIRWHNRAANAGSQSLPNNDGIALARGELIAYLGHDNLWTPDHLTRLVEAQRRAGADVAFSLSEVIGPPGSGMRNVSGFKPDGYGGGHLPPSSVLHRRSLVERIGPWRDYREIEQPPDTELLERAHRRRRVVCLLMGADGLQAALGDAPRLLRGAALRRAAGAGVADGARAGLPAARAGPRRRQPRPSPAQRPESLRPTGRPGGRSGRLRARRAPRPRPRSLGASG